MQALVVFPLFWLVNTATLPGLYVGLILLSIGLGLAYGPLVAWYAEIFPASVRFSGVAIPYAIGSILGGAFAPTISQALLQATGTTATISWYLLVATLVGAAAALCLRDRRGIPLGPDHEAEQASGATMFAPNVAHREVCGEAVAIPLPSHRAI